VVMSFAKKTQIQIYSMDVLGDGILVKQLLLEVKAKYCLFDNSPTSRVPNTIISVVEHENRGFGIGARVFNDFIIVDFMPNKNPPAKFGEICDYITCELISSFPDMIQRFTEEESTYIKTSAL
jgi:hypothetical protein